MRDRQSWLAVRKRGFNIAAPARDTAALLARIAELEAQIPQVSVPEWPAISEEWAGLLTSGIRSTAPAAYNRASSLGHPCLRALYYERTGAEREPLGEAILGIFRLGNELEQVAMRTLQELGYRVERAQEDLEYALGETVLWRGHPDGLITHPLYPGRRWLVDAKSCNSAIWNQIPRDPDEATAYLTAAKQPWLRKYAPQMIAYLACYWRAGYPVDGAVLVFVNKDTMQVKAASVSLTDGLVKGLVDKALAINSAVAALEPPAVCGDWGVCERCGYRETVCHPAVTVEGDKIVDIDAPENAPTLASLRVWIASRVAQAEAEKAEKAFKEAFKRLEAGTYHVEGVGSVMVKRNKNGVATVSVKDEGGQENA